MADVLRANADSALRERWKDNGDGTYSRVMASAAVNADGSSQTALPPGRAAATSSVPTVASNEDFARLGSIAFGGANATVAAVSSAASSKLLLAANAARTGAIIANDSTAILYVLFGTGTASVTNYSIQIGAKATIPLDRVVSGYTGAIQGAWATANGNALVTEFS
jgi:hypothetical protein